MQRLPLRQTLPKHHPCSHGATGALALPEQIRRYAVAICPWAASSHCSVCSVFPRWPRAVVKCALRVTGGVLGLLVLGLGAMPALAIPEAEAIRKLEAVAVYVVVSAEGQPAFYQESPDQLVLPMFMKAEQARQAQKTLEARPDTEGSRVVSIPLNVAFERNEKLVQEIKEKDESKSLLTPLVPAQEDWKKAEEILLAQGIAKDEIARNLKVPVFFTDPPISITPPGTDEPKIALFFNYSQLQQAKQAVPDFDGEEKVVNLPQAINIVIQDEEDRYFFFPTEDMIKAIQAQQEEQGQQEEQEQEPSS